MEIPTLAGPRACRSCAISKAKCIFLSHGAIPNGRCRRCNRLDKECILQTPAPRRRQYAAHTSSPMSDVVFPSHSDASALPVLNKVSAIKAPSFQTSFFSCPAAFLGPTSFSSVFEENKTNFNSDCSPERPISEAPGDMSPEFVRLGVKVLGQIPNQTNCNTLFSRHVNPNDGWIRLAGERLSDSIFSSFGSYLSSKQIRDLASVAQLICCNTMLVLHEEDEPVNWINSFSGQNLRWESIGILFTYWAFGAISLPENDPMFENEEGARKDRRQYMQELKECAASCIALCSLVDRGNPLVVYLLYKHCLLESLISGDASLTCWRQLGDLAAMTTALGLHRDSSSNKISIASEMRRRIYAAVFNIDKVFATFMGRPPFLSSRYSSIPLPLDLSDEDLLAGEPTLAIAVAKLDEGGWSLNGEIYSTTILRARTLFSFVRDEILTIALGSPMPHIEEHIRELKTRSLTLYTQLPEVIKYNPSDISNPAIPSRTLYSRLLTRLENLQNLFLLERLLTKNYGADGIELIGVCTEMLAMTSGIWKQRERLRGVESDFEWVIMYHAVPAAGILCVELLKRTTISTLPISETIQNLSLLIGFLDWIKPAAPNSELCYRIRDIVRKVLDQVLDTPQQMGGADVGMEMAWADMDFNLSDFDDYANLDLLDTFDWVCDPWGGG